ncbi:hypothetical protein [Paenibacillus gansuensis]|uniref:DUF998 domain-containing protein n=1 Tax=Paenibacillus gansuensis TaxID=306542 RepID=A0ABW5PCJ3_9BACL
MRHEIRMRIGYGLVAGLAAGIGMGYLLKGIENGTGSKVYTLLLSVDYVPGLRDIITTEFAQFGIHLVLSVAVAALFSLGYRTNSARGKRLAVIAGASVLLGVVLFPTTALSSRTPELSDAAAFGWWLLGHLMYGLIVGAVLQLLFERNPGRP